MCRHIAYLGEKKSLETVLLKKKHSLIDMAYKPKEMENATLNADGYGIGWMLNNDFFLYKSILPIWNDTNLYSISKNISSNFFLANVRSATIPGDLSYNNTHPFVYEDFIFSHNGFVKNFNSIVKEKILSHINSKYLSKIKGSTDSEYIFYLLLSSYNRVNSITDAAKESINILKKYCNEAMLNFIFSFKYKNNISIYATRISINLNSPSLYYFISKENNIFISSEKLNELNWIKVKDSSLLEFNKNKLNISNL